MKKLIFVFIFGFIFLAFNVKTINDNQTTWERYFLLGQVGEDWAMTSCVVTDGNYLIGGYSKDLPNKSFVIKMTPDGDTLWARKFERNIVETVVALSICPTVDNGCIFGGSTNKLNLVKLNENGDIVWNINYTEDQHSVSAIKQMKDGKFVVTGIKYPFTARIFKIDENGNIIWDRLHPELSGFGPFVETSDSGVIVLSEIQSTAVVKFNKDGIIKWQRAAPNGAFPGVINYIGDNKFLLSGRKEFIIDEDGIILNQFEIPINPQEIYMAFLYSSTTDSISTMVRVTARMFPLPYTSRITAYNFNGEILNENYIYDYNNDSREIRSISTTQDGYILTGIRNYYTGSESSRSSIGKAMIIKTDSLLNYKTVGINNNGITMVDDFSIKVYPNPFNPTTNISIELTQETLNNGELFLEIFDVRGAIINREKIIPDGNLRITKQITLTGYQSGIYFARVSGGNLNSNTIKLVMLK